MIILTCCDNESKASFLKETAEHVGLQYRYIIVTNWKSYVDKIIQIQEAISILDDDEIVCFTDAYDILAFGTEDEIMTKFEAFNCELVISAELNCYPIENEHAYGYGNKQTEELVQMEELGVQPEELGVQPVVQTKELVQTEEPVVQPVVADESPESGPTSEQKREVYRKMNITQLKTLAIAADITADVSKMKKLELIKLLESLDE